MRLKSIYRKRNGGESIRPACLARIVLTLLAGILLSESDLPARQAASAHSSFQKFPTTDRERERAHAREQFAKHFKEIQVTSQTLVKEHENSTLTAARLSKGVKNINKSSRTLRTLIALGELATERELKTDFSTTQDFDDAIRQLAKLIWDFAHNPVHQNNKVFNTELAAKAQTDLLSIINLSRAIESQAKGYRPLSGER